MGNCDLIYMLNDGTELTDKVQIDKHKHLYPSNILEIIKPYRIIAEQNATDWKRSIIRIYQNGQIEPEYNIPNVNISNDIDL